MTTTTKSKHREAEIRELFPRYLAARKLAMEWMRSVGASYRGLARRIQEHQMYISRFLDEDARSAPCSARPAMMRVMEKIERSCSTLDDVLELSIDEEQVELDDARLWARNHMLRLRTLRERLHPGQGLVHVAELSEQALHAGTKYRPDMCTHVLLSLASMLADPRAEQSSPELLRRSVARIDRLEHAVLEVTPEAVYDFRPQRAIGYAGLARGYAGLWLSDRMLIALAVRRTLEAATTPHRVSDGLWHNALKFLEELLGRSVDGAERWASQAARSAAVDDSECLHVAFLTRELPMLRAHWAHAAPDLLHRLSTEEVTR